MPIVNDLLTGNTGGGPEWFCIEILGVENFNAKPLSFRQAAKITLFSKN